MVRFFCVLIGIYNFMLLMRVWALSSHYFLKPIQNIFSPIGPIFVIVMVVFFIVHSIRLILFYEMNRKIQMIISAIDPFLRIFVFVMIIITRPEMQPTYLNITLSLLIFIALDAFVIFYLRLKTTKTIFSKAEEWRKEKFIKKLSSKNIKTA
jgi:hypothetical protein